MPPPNPYAPQNFAQVQPPQNLPAWICAPCRKENPGNYQFCLGCGGERRSVDMPSAYGGPGVVAGRPTPRGPIVLIAAIAGVLVALLCAGAAMFLLR